MNGGSVERNRRKKYNACDRMIEKQKINERRRKKRRERRRKRKKRMDEGREEKDCGKEIDTPRKGKRGRELGLYTHVLHLRKSHNNHRLSTPPPPPPPTPALVHSSSRPHTQSLFLLSTLPSLSPQPFYITVSGCVAPYMVA